MFCRAAEILGSSACEPNVNMRSEGEHLRVARVTVQHERRTGGAVGNLVDRDNPETWF